MSKFITQLSLWDQFLNRFGLKYSISVLETPAGGIQLVILLKNADKIYERERVQNLAEKLFITILIIYKKDMISNLKKPKTESMFIIAIPIKIFN